MSYVYLTNANLSFYNKFSNRQSIAFSSYVRKELILVILCMALVSSNVHRVSFVPLSVPDPQGLTLACKVHLLLTTTATTNNYFLQQKCWSVVQNGVSTVSINFRIHPRQKTKQKKPSSVINFVRLFKVLNCLIMNHASARHLHADATEHRTVCCWFLLPETAVWAISLKRT